MQPPIMGGLELVLLLAIWVLFIGVAPYVTWRRGGSRRRIVSALALSLVPYIGLIAGAIVALTTKRSRPVADGATRLEDATRSVSEPTPRAGLGSASGRAAVVVFFVMASVASGLLGYYISRQGVQVSLPTWTDREIRATGTQNVGTLRCTYHMADGTVRVRESVITLSTNAAYDPFGARNPSSDRTPECPSAP